MVTCYSAVSFLVSIHAPREGCDGRLADGNRHHLMFQFTHPGRGATHVHASSRLPLRSFNSRTPGGVRHNGTD